MTQLIFTVTLVVFILQSIVLGSIGTSTMELASGQPGQTSQPSNDPGSYKTVNYYARFNCGTIADDSGPLRPGNMILILRYLTKKAIQ